MRRVLASLLLVGPLLGQGWSLATRLPTPALFVALDADFARRLRTLLPDSAIARVLRDSGCKVPTDALHLLGRVTDLCQGTMEVALGASDGAVVVHCELPAAAAGKVQALIDDETLVERVSAVDDAPVVALRGGRATPAGPSSLYLALADRHLVVASTESGVRQLLIGAAAAQTLAEDGDYRDLVRRVDPDQRSLTVYGAWPEISASIARHLPSALVGSWYRLAGELDARSMLLTVRPTSGGLLSTVLVRPANAAAATARWAFAERVPLSALAADLPRSGVASMTFAFDASSVRKGEGPRLGLLSPSAMGCRADAGLALEQQLLPRLKGIAGIHVVPAGGGATRAYIAKAKSERDAQRVLADCRRFFAERGGLEVRPHQAGEELLLPVHAVLGGRPRLGVVRDSVVLGTEAGVVERVALADAAADPKGASWAVQALKHLPGPAQRQVTGVVLLDLTSLLPRDDAVLSRHAGSLRSQSDHIRLELFSPL